MSKQCFSHNICHKDCGENLVHLSSLGDEGLAGEGHGKEEERLSMKILDVWNKHGTKTKTSIVRRY